MSKATHQRDRPAVVGFESLRRRVHDCFVCSSMNHCHILGDANGPLDAEVLFVAEAPGRLGAARTGLPMTSDVTGRRFHAFLTDAGIDRERVFITNSILCNPLTSSGNNRPPKASEIAACRGFLKRTIELVRAPIVVALGGVALDTLRHIATHDGVLARDVGEPLRWPVTVERTLVPMYHPSIQSTMSRAHETQRDDWRRLGAIVRERM